MSIPENPHTRIERYLDAMAGGEGTKPSEPHTRIERYLDVLSDKPSLPEVTAADNGKVMTVINGEWDADTINTLPDVTASDNDKTLRVSGGAWEKTDKFKIGTTPTFKGFGQIVFQPRYSGSGQYYGSVFVRSGFTSKYLEMGTKDNRGDTYIEATGGSMGFSAPTGKKIGYDSVDGSANDPLSFASKSYVDNAIAQLKEGLGI